MKDIKNKQAVEKMPAMEEKQLDTYLLDEILCDCVSQSNAETIETQYNLLKE